MPRPHPGQSEERFAIVVCFLLKPIKGDAGGSGQPGAESLVNYCVEQVVEGHGESRETS